MQQERETASTNQKFGLLLFVCILELLMSAFAPSTQAGDVLAMLFLVILPPLVVKLAGASRRFVIAGWIILAVGCTVAAIGQVIHAPNVVAIAYNVMQLLIQLFIAWVIMRALASHAHMTAQSIFAASSLYVMIGIVFAKLYAVIQSITGTPFLSAARAIVPSDFIYYSFVTLTTIGFGDLVATSEIGRILSVIESITGSLYLVTVVALIVSNVHPHRN